MTHTTIDVPKFDDVEFDETTHTYRVNGVVLPSVTTVMKPLSSSFYEAVDAGTLSNAADRGTAVHQAIENFLEYGIEDISPEHAGYFAAFKAFLADKNPIIIATETKLYHKFLRYAGTADLLCIIDGKVYLIDYKTTSVLVDMLVGVQLEAYAKAYESFGVKIDAKATLHLRPNGKYGFKEYKSQDTECWSVFGSLLTVLQYINKFKRK